MAENFDPDSYLASKENLNISAAPVSTDAVQERQFNPDNYLAQKENSNYEALQQKYGGVGNEALAGLAGAARGLSLGISDVGLVKSGLVSPETLKGLQEANPISSGAGQLAGGAGLISATGGAGGLTEGAGLATKLGASAVEGGAFGLGNAISDYAMGDPNLNAQKIAAHIGAGALFGIGAGSLAEGIRAVLPEASSAISSSLNKLTDRVTPIVEGSDNATGWADKIKLGLEGGVDGPKLKARELSSNLQEIHNASKKAATALYEEAAPANISEALKDMPTDSARQIGLDTLNKMEGVIGGNVDEAPLSSPQSVKIVSDLIDSAKEDIGKARSSDSVFNKLSDIAKDIDSKKIIKFDTMPTAGQMGDQEILMNMRNAIRGDLKNNSLWGDAATHYSELSDNYSAYKNSLKNFQKSFMKLETGPSGQRRFIVDPGKISTFFNNFGEISQDLKKQYLNEFISQANNLSKASENYSGFVKGTESISDHVASLAKKNENLTKIADVMSSNGSSKTGLGTLGLVSWGAEMLGIPRPITGALLGMTKAYDSISNPYQTGVNLSSVFSKLKSVSDILEKTDSKIASYSKSIFSENSERAISSGLAGLGDKQYNKNSSRISELANNPQQLYNHLENSTKQISDVMPNISSGLYSTISNGIQFLNSKIPKPTNELPLNAKWEATPSQKAKFNKYYQIVNDPISVLNQVKNGTLSSEAMETLQTVHPDLLQKMRQEVMQNMTSKKISNLNYSTKITLSKFLGQPLESAMMPQVVMANQASFAMPSKGQDQVSTQGKGQKSTLGGIKELGGSNRELTYTQRLEKMNIPK